MFLLPQTAADYCELLFYVYASHRVLTWLRHDHQSPLFRYSISYVTSLTLAYIIPLPIIFYGLLYTFPLLSCLIVIFHTNTLQKNLIAHKRIAIKQPIIHDWLTALMTCYAHSLHQEQTLKTIIDCDNIASLLHTPYDLNCPVQKELLLMLTDKQNMHDHHILWLHAHGTIKSNRAQWLHNSDAEFDEVATWCTTNNNSIALCGNMTNHTITVVINGTFFTDLITQQAKRMINHHIAQDTKKKENLDVPIYKKQPEQQHNR